MERLTELLNQFSEEKCPWMFKYTNQESYINMKFVYWGEWKINDETICCKSYWFIEWLVENNYIEWKTFGEMDTKSSWYSDFELNENAPMFDYTNTLLMELSLHEEPLKILCKLLK